MKNDKIIKQMEFLIEELHKEWETSKVTKKEIAISFNEMDQMRFEVGKRICDITEFLKVSDLKFKEAMLYSKESYVLLRMAKKMVKAQDKAKKNDKDNTIYLPLDKEEMKLFQEMFVMKK